MVLHHASTAVCPSTELQRRDTCTLHGCSSSSTAAAAAESGIPADPVGPVESECLSSGVSGSFEFDEQSSTSASSLSSIAVLFSLFLARARSLSALIHFVCTCFLCLSPLPFLGCLLFYVSLSLSLSLFHTHCSSSFEQPHSLVFCLCVAPSVR